MNTREQSRLPMVSGITRAERLEDRAEEAAETLRELYPVLRDALLGNVDRIESTTALAKLDYVASRLSAAAKASRQLRTTEHNVRSDAAESRLELAAWNDAFAARHGLEVQR
jgi:hypothetical protein